MYPSLSSSSFGAGLAELEPHTPTTESFAVFAVFAVAVDILSLLRCLTDERATAGTGTGLRSSAGASFGELVELGTALGTVVLGAVLGVVREDTRLGAWEWELAVEDECVRTGAGGACGGAAAAAA